MKVNSNKEVPASTPRPTEAKQVGRPSDTNTPDFVAANKLAQQLAATPDVRADEVARAKALIADPNYPDDATIRAVARQIADAIHPAAEVNKVG